MIKVYVGNKPNPYGFLFRSLCDAKNIYLLNFKLYGEREKVSDSSILKLMERLVTSADLNNKGYTVVADNFYGDITTMEHFYINLKCHSVFTLRKNRKFIPDQLKVERG